MTKAGLTSGIRAGLTAGYTAGNKAGVRSEIGFETRFGPDPEVAFNNEFSSRLIRAESMHVEEFSAVAQSDSFDADTATGTSGLDLRLIGVRQTDSGPVQSDVDFSNLDVTSMLQGLSSGLKTVSSRNIINQAVVDEGVASKGFDVSAFGLEPLSESVLAYPMQSNDLGGDTFTELASLVDNGMFNQGDLFKVFVRIHKKNK